MIDLDGNGQIDLLEFETWAMTIPFLRQIFVDEKVSAKALLTDAKDAAKLLIKSDEKLYYYHI